MRIFLDTADVAAIREYNDMGLVDGITTNPTLLAREGRDPAEAMAEIAGIVSGPVSLEVVATDHRGMIAEGLRLREYGENVVVKCPMTADGLKACRDLARKAIPVNVTLVFSASQAILAAKAGARYISPFIGRIDDTSHDGMMLVEDIIESLANYDYGARVLVASVRHPMHVVEAAKLGADVVTLPPAVLGKMIRHPLTDIGLKAFLDDWEKLKTGGT